MGVLYTSVAGKNDLSALILSDSDLGAVSIQLHSALECIGANQNAFRRTESCRNSHVPPLRLRIAQMRERHSGYRLRLRLTLRSPYTGRFHKKLSGSSRGP